MRNSAFPTTSAGASRRAQSSNIGLATITGMTKAPNALSLSEEHRGVGMLGKRHVSAVQRVYRAKATERVRDLVGEKSNDTH